MIVDQALKEATAELAGTAGICGEPHMQRLRSSGHNRLFKVAIGNANLLLKRYFVGIGERRDRLRAEFTFSRFAWALGLRDIREPIVADYTRHMALYRFVDGTRASSAHITPANLAAAADFVARINQDRDGLAARALPPAFGSVWSVAQHSATIGERLLALRERADGVRVDGFARELIEDRLRPAWTRIAAALRECPDPSAAERCLSPSDFGFHNMLIGGDERLIFHDFEYSGWDDPARLVAELFAQPQMPVPGHLFTSFAEAIRDALGLTDAFVDRAARLLPLYRVYSCCALLDEMLPAEIGQAKRKPARDAIDQRWTMVEQAIAELRADGPW